MASWQQKQQYRPHSSAFSQPPSYGYRANQQPAPPKQQAPPQPLHRLKSEFKSLYPMTKWCATYINTKSNANTGDWADDKVDLTSPIPSTNVYLPMDLEENIMAEIDMYIDEDKDTLQRLENQKLDVQKQRDLAEKERADKVDTFMTFTSITDKQVARQLLEDTHWDLEAATQKQFTSSPDIGNLAQGALNYSEGNVGQSIDMDQMNGNNYQQATPKAVIRIMLPDNRQYTYQMDAHDTFWGVYGRLLQAVPELQNKPGFNLELKATGHTMKESEFDQTLQQAGLVPNGEIVVKY